MSVEGLRAWISEVERKLTARTRVFLALAVIAIGLGGAAIYLAIDTRESAVSESDVQALQEQLETRIGETSAGTATTPAPPVEAEPAPQPEGEPEPGNGKANGEASGTGGGGARIQELLEKAQKKNAEAEAKQNGR